MSSTDPPVMTDLSSVASVFNGNINTKLATPLACLHVSQQPRLGCAYIKMLSGAVVTE